MKIQLKIRSKQFTIVHKLQLQFNQFNQFIGSVRFVSLLFSETIIERGALQYVIKPFLYCDLFKVSARAKKKKKKEKHLSLKNSYVRGSYIESPSTSTSTSTSTSSIIEKLGSPVTVYLLISH